MDPRIVLPILSFALIFSEAFANTQQQAIEFFKQYTDNANTYDAELLDMYSPNAKIIREVVKPSGETVDVVVPASKYFNELKIGQKTAKLRRYKNKYRNVKTEEIPNGIKISAERQPTNETYWLKMYQIVQNTDSGMKIKEEMMQTKVQAFLRHQK